MAYISSLRVNGVDYKLKDAEARELIQTLRERFDDLEGREIQFRVQDGYLQYSNDGETWTNLTKVQAAEVSPEKVVFAEDVYAAHSFGTFVPENGRSKMLSAGDTLADFIGLLDEVKDPEMVQPGVELTFAQARAYEVGTKVTPEYSAVLNPGSYTYGPETGVEVIRWKAEDTLGNILADSSGAFPEVQVTDGMSYGITIEAEHSAGAVPVKNNGDEYPEGQIAAGVIRQSSGRMTGYRNGFYGSVTEKGEISSEMIRALKGSGKALQNGSSFTVPVDVGAVGVVIAYPAVLRDMTSVKDVNGMNAEIGGSFERQIVSVAGANGYAGIDYKVYAIWFANANDAANNFAVTI